MKNNSNTIGKLGLVFGSVLSAALTGCVGYVDAPPPHQAYRPPPPVYVRPPVAQVVVSAGSVGFEIRAEADFYEPLTPYGRWEVIGSYGRCWIPGRVEADWRPYSNGNWQRTDAGWYWASDEPWGWATYHYGRWDLSPQFGWYWVPQTQWAPAWVSWHEGGGYVGWAPLQPSARIAVGGSVTVNVALIAPRAFVFVEPRRFLQPVRPTTVVVNNTTIINNTVNITNVKVVNNTVINEGPRTTTIEQASGLKVQPVAVHELRRKEEAPVIARKRVAAPVPEKQQGVAVQTPVRSEPESRPVKVPLNTAPQAKEPEAAVQAQSQQRAKELEIKTQAESQRLANVAAAKAREESRIKTKESEITPTTPTTPITPKRDPQPQGNEALKNPQAEAQRTAKELETRTRAETQRHAHEAAVKAQDEAQKNGKLGKQPQQVPAQADRQRAAANEKGATKLMRKDRDKDGKEPQPQPTQPPPPPVKPVLDPPTTSP